MIDFEQTETTHSDAVCFFNDVKTVEFKSEKEKITVRVCQDYDFFRKKDLKNRGVVFAEINYQDEGKRKVLREYVDQDIFEFQRDSFFEQIVDLVNDSKYF